MASSPITSRQIDGETMETVTDFIFLGSKINADSDYSYEVKRHLLLGKVMTNLNSILLFFFNFNFYFILLYNTVLVLPYIDMNPPRCTCIPNHEPPCHLPPHNISLGHHRSPAPSMLYPVLDIDWQFDSYMIVYMLQCHSPKSSHPLPLSLPLSYCFYLHFTDRMSEA